METSLKFYAKYSISYVEVWCLVVKARVIVIDSPVGKVPRMIFGHFLEHFHRQIYGGIFEPKSPLSDEMGFRTDVLKALQRIKPPIIRWPGGCFASAYHWKHGVDHRVPVYDKAWLVEDPNTFGTDEFIEFCRRVGAEPYICGNAGTGSEEELSEWVEYCNLRDLGQWSRLRAANGHPKPYGVKFWSIGNENYLWSDMGAKETDRWSIFVRESAKMMKRVDPTIKLAVASSLDINWVREMLKKTMHRGRPIIDYISIHGYWGKNLKYEEAMEKSKGPEQRIERAEHILSSLGFTNMIKIAFDEWNLRGWHHPFTDNRDADLKARNLNDDNSQYTMADAVFSATFLNTCLRHCRTVTMANYSPTVNARGMIFTYPTGIVLRSTYHVFNLYSNQTGQIVLNNFSTCESFQAGEKMIEALDITATCSENLTELRLCIVNKSPDEKVELKIETSWGKHNLSAAKQMILSGESKDSYNSIHHPNTITIKTKQMPDLKNRSTINIPKCSINIIILPLKPNTNFKKTFCSFRKL